MTELDFRVDRDLNLFCHTLTMFPESYRSEGSAFNNPQYRKAHSHLRTKSLSDLFSKLLPLGWGDWDFVGLSLISSDTSDSSSEGRLLTAAGSLARTWSAILKESWKGYSTIWPDVESRLSQYRSRLRSDWEPISENVIRSIRRISETTWNPDNVHVYLVDCLYGGASYLTTILLAPVPDLEIEKKLLCHELSEGAFATGNLQERLEAKGISSDVSHTVVDTTAYVALKSWLKSEYVERLKPKQHYYVGAESVYTAFEQSDAGSEAYKGLDGLLGIVAKELAARS